MSAYVTAKTALIRRTDVLAAEAKPHGYRGVCDGTGHGADRHG
ncbi:MAG: hypothetical protein FJW31_10835 [Acidobacteria bacterium]|nr:hypothetical protein [Acidobacteriota bacterium]